jgi:hypothetical protein
VLFITTLLIQFYVRVDNLLTCEKHMHDHMILQRWQVLSHETSLIRHILIKYLYSIRKASGHVYVMYMCVKGFNIFVCVSTITSI